MLNARLGPMCDARGMASTSEDRDEIRDLFARYCVHMDAGEAAEWAALFTEDGVFDMGTGPIVGREALAVFAGSIGGSMHHMVMNEVIDVGVDPVAWTLDSGGDASERSPRWVVRRSIRRSSGVKRSSWSTARAGRVLRLRGVWGSARTR